MRREVFAESAIKFYFSLKCDIKTPEGVEILNPLKNKEVKEVLQKFYRKYYNDSKKRIFILGINPGRFGAGLTGITFTDPINLAEKCKIENNFIKKPELSSTFIYEVIKNYGGVKKFYLRFYLGAVSPIGFTKDGKNLNYYDFLDSSLKDFIVQSMQKQIGFGAVKEVCICLGEGKNYKSLKSFNEKHNFFDEIISLPHPRFIMQYRRKRMTNYVKMYMKKLNKCEEYV